MTIDVHIFYLRSHFQVFINIYSGVGLLDHIAVLFLIFRGNSIPFSIKVATFCISNNSKCVGV